MAINWGNKWHKGCNRLSILDCACHSYHFLFSHTREFKKWMDKRERTNNSK